MTAVGTTIVSGAFPLISNLAIGSGGESFRPGGYAASGEQGNIKAGAVSSGLEMLNGGCWQLGCWLLFVNKTNEYKI